MSRRAFLPPVLQDESFDLPEWMEYGQQFMRVPDHYWKYFPAHVQHRFDLADYLENYPVADNVPLVLSRMIRRYLSIKGVLPLSVRLRRTNNGEYGKSFAPVIEYFGLNFVERYYHLDAAHPKQHWADRIRSHRAPHEFAQSEEMGNIWPEALIAQVQLDFHFKSAAFEELRMTPEKQAEEDYYNALNDAKWFNEHIDALLEFLRNDVRRRNLAPTRIVRKWAVAPKHDRGLGLATKRYDHSLNKNLPTFLGPRAWHFIQSFYDPETRKHSLIHRDELIKRLDDERPAVPEPPSHLVAEDNRPVVFDDFGEVVPVRWDEERQLWIDDFGDPVSVETQT